MKLLEKIKEVLIKDNDIIFAYFYGTASYGMMHSFSDIDIAVYIDSDEREFLLKKDNELLSNFSFLSSKIDIRILNVMPLVLKFEVVSSGGLLFSKDEQKRIDFETAVYIKYFELKPFLDEENKIISEKIKAY